MRVLRIWCVLLLVLSSQYVAAVEVGSGFTATLAPPPLPAIRTASLLDNAAPAPLLLPAPVHDNILDALIGKGAESESDEKNSKLASKPSLSAGMPGVTQLVTVIGSLLFVIGCFLLFSMLLRKVSPHAAKTLPKELFENLGRVALTPKIQLQLLRLGNRLILVSVTLDGATSVTEIADPDEVMQILGMCKKLDPNSATATFRRVLQREPVRETSRPHEGLAHLLTTGLVGNGAVRAGA